MLPLSKYEFNILKLYSKMENCDFNYLDISSEGKFTAIHKSKFNLFNKDNIYNSEFRRKYEVEIKPSKIFSKIDKEIDYSFLTKLNDLFSFNKIENEYELKVVSGEDIRKYYNEEYYSDENEGTLQCSCMRYDYKSPFFDIYVCNENISMVCLFKEDALMARALLWKTEEGIVFLDRIYTTYNNEFFYLKQWAMKQGYYSKYINKASFFDDDLTTEENKSLFKIVDPEGNIILKELTIKLNYGKFQYLPYLDSFNIFTKDDKLAFYYTDTIEDNNRLCRIDGNICYRCSYCNMISYESIHNKICECGHDTSED